jgi:hypothetical protein
LTEKKITAINALAAPIMDGLSLYCANIGAA